MKRAKNLKCLGDALNRMFVEEEERSTGGLKIRQENKNFKEEVSKVKTLTERQSDVMANIEKDLGISSTNNNTKEVNKNMTKQKVNQKKGAVVVAPKVDLKKVEMKAVELLGELKKAVNSGLKLELVKTKSYCAYKFLNKIVFAIRYNTKGSLHPQFAISSEQYKELGIKGKFGTDWWVAEYKLENGNIANLKPVAELAIQNIKSKVAKKTAVAPKAKTAPKPVAKKNKTIVKHI